MAHNDDRTVPGRPEVEQLLAERGDHLVRAAIALAGSRPEGEDLLQTALERVLRRWSRIEGDPEGYLRRTLYKTRNQPQPMPLPSPEASSLPSGMPVQSP